MVLVEYKVGDYVDVLDRQGWWSGVLDDVIGDDVYDVSLLTDGEPVHVCDLRCSDVGMSEDIVGVAEC
ncbi:hypothetical protein L1887_32303 [Cichorium endivia]|nr:hypothetical protein L1887_32303 [Cichorium endivia]